MIKKLLSLLSIIATVLLQAQYDGHTCGFDEVQRELERMHPEIRENRQVFEKRLRKQDQKAFLKKIGAKTVAGKYTGEIYEIPVVVHIIESKAESNKHLSLTDEQIQTWIENCNKMYATTYGNGYYEEGDGADGGTVIPFRLVLAKRTPQCTATNGIIRYNGSSLKGYDAHGVNRKNKDGVNSSQIRELAPHWPEGAYFNIYIVIGFDGNKSTSGLMGWCGYPTNSDAFYDSFMKVTVVTNKHSSTLAHEFGHGMGLMHPFEGTNTTPDIKGMSSTDCPVNNNCSEDNDKVCDTEPTANLLKVRPVPTNDDINVCTGKKYKGIQYNIMNYTAQKRKFTPGQRDRALQVFMNLRGNLTKSKGAIPPDEGVGKIDIVPANCTPSLTPTIDKSYNMGPREVILRNIAKKSSGNSTSAPSFYDDFTLISCSDAFVYTDIPKDEPSELIIKIETNPQHTRAWIDYNNNGVFESEEEIGYKHILVDGITKTGEHTFTFTPPTDAMKNVYLRMRVIADWNNNKSPCDRPLYGQVEDYAVKIVEDDELSVKSTNNFQKSEDKLLYIPSSNKLILYSVTGFGTYKIYDVSGKLLQQGITNSKEISLKRNLPKGTYIIIYDNKERKFIK